MTDLSHVRHTLAHLLAASTLTHYPEAKLTLGPAVDNGFYYDIDFDDTKVTDSDLAKLERTMRELLPSWSAFTHATLSLEEAREHFKDNPFKLELVEEIAGKGEPITLYTCGNFTDLCRGGHVEHPSKDIVPDSFMLDRIAGAYWRGDERNKMLTRIYGLAFGTKEELDTHLLQREEAKKRDHRKLGAELDIFAFDDDVGPGLPLWLPNGAIMIEELEKLAKEMEEKGGYLRVRTPHIAKNTLYITSGHLPYYEESMYPPMAYEGGIYYLKAMNCPHHHKIFASRPKSYRDMPVRYAEYGTCYRHEKSGELFGLMRVRSLQMNDAHIYCSQGQFADEFKAVIELYLTYFRIFGIDKYIMRLSKHSPEKLGEKYIDEPELWKKTEDMVRACLTDLKVPFVEAEDEGAFYGPKVDVEIWSVIGREFTLATNQIDFAVPKRFGLTYTDASGAPQTPLCIHRAPLSTHERMIGFLIEHYGGAFPLWLSPVQTTIVPVSEKHADYARSIHRQLRDAGIRAELSEANESLGKRIREAKTMKIPYLVVVGDEEVVAFTGTLEGRSGKIGALSISDIIARLQEEIRTRA